MRTRKGFTLIELLAVIVILAIIIIIATMQVNKTIKKSKKDANEINKKQIQKAVKTCLVENEEDNCDSVTKLIEGGYLDDFDDPWNSEDKDKDRLYPIIISAEDVRVIYVGEGITQENETPPAEYFSWCNSDNGKKSCIDGLTSKGKDWLQKHDDILIIPSTVKNIKNCENKNKDCTDFSGVTIEALITTSSTNISASFSGTKINAVKLYGGSLSNNVFSNITVKSFVIGDVNNIKVGEHTFTNSKVDYFEIENGSFSWYGFQRSKIGTLVLGEGVTNIGSNTFEGTNIDKIILKSSKLTGNENQPFRNSNYDTTLVIKKSVTKLNPNVFANTFTSYGAYVRFFNLKEVIIEGDKTRFSKKDLYNFGLRWDQIPDDVGNPLDLDSYNLKLNFSNYGNSYKMAKEYAKTHPWLIVDE